MVKISILTPTIRPTGLKLVEKALKSQLFEDFEWLVGSPFKPDVDCVWVKDNFKDGYWSLNRIYNALIKKAKGELLVSWQDFIWAPKEALDKFWYGYQQTKGIVTGVGDQYSQLNEYGKPECKIWSDPRKTSEYGSFYEIHPDDAEFNFCAFPKQAALDVGGFDSGLDLIGVGGDQLQFCERIDVLKKYRFFIDQTNESFTLRHGREDFGGEDEWNKKHVLFATENGTSLYDKRKNELMASGKWPILEYLS